MPVYTYRCCKCDRIQDSVRPMEARDDAGECEECGAETARDMAEELGGVQTDWPEPIYSDAAGVHPDQVPEARGRFKNHEYTPDGRMIFRSKRHRDQCLRDIGMFDKDGYG